MGAQRPLPPRATPRFLGRLTTVLSVLRDDNLRLHVHAFADSLCSLTSGSMASLSPSSPSRRLKFTVWVSATELLLAISDTGQCFPEPPAFALNLTGPCSQFQRNVRSWFDCQATIVTVYPSLMNTVELTYMRIAAQICIKAMVLMPHYANLRTDSN